MLPNQQIEEQVSWAHVQAVASLAGIDISPPRWDCGVDGTFRPISKTASRYCIDGYALDFQLKASTRCQLKPEHVVYDLEVKTYNDLIYRSLSNASIPCILILKALPASDTAGWTELSESGLFLKGGCYWEYLQGDPSSNDKTVRVRISRNQQLTPESLLFLLQRISTGEWP